ncbi:MAG: DNA-binding CsgD family transcriptional regulator [Paracoccaceae bacterium]|jgi:DNA-binding CsgD family transcriptional regulator
MVCKQTPVRQLTAGILFSTGFLQQISLHVQVRVHPFQPTVLVRRRIWTRGVCTSLQGLHLAGYRRVHHAILRPPRLERRVAHPVLVAQLRHRQTALSLAQDHKNLGLAKSLHRNLSRYLAEKILLLQPLSFWGDSQCGERFCAARQVFPEITEERFSIRSLTAAEGEIAHLTLKGFNANEDAVLLNMTAGTVRAQLSGIYAKSGLCNRGQCVSSLIDDLLETLI